MSTKLAWTRHPKGAAGANRVRGQAPQFGASPKRRNTPRGAWVCWRTLPGCESKVQVVLVEGLLAGRRRKVGISF